MTTQQEYKVDWTTTIIDKDGGDGGEVSTNVSGYLILLADGVEDAREVAENLVDVDFFHPGASLSPSDPDVLRGEMWMAEYPAATTTNLAALLPDVKGWTFEKIEVVNVQKHDVTLSTDFTEPVIAPMSEFDESYGPAWVGIKRTAGPKVEWLAHIRCEGLCTSNVLHRDVTYGNVFWVTKDMGRPAHAFDISEAETWLAGYAYGIGKAV